MLNRKNWCLSLGASLLFHLSVLDTSASAVDPPTGVTSGANQNMVTQFKGTLKGLQRGVMVVARDDGKEILVQPPDDLSAFQFVATAKPGFLQRGMMVRFNGTFNQAGMAMAPVPRLEIFQPISGKVVGHSREKFLPGVHPDRKDHGKPPQQIANYTVVGQLMAWDASGGIMVRAGQRTVRTQLTQNAQLDIRFNNLNLAKEGDPVTVSGFYQPHDETKVKGDRVTITTDRIYGEVTEPTKRVSRRRGRGEETDKDKPDNAEQKEVEAKNGEAEQATIRAGDAKSGPGGENKNPEF